MSALHETRYGQRLFDSHVPRAVEAIETFAKAMKSIAESVERIAVAVEREVDRRRHGA